MLRATSGGGGAGQGSTIPEESSRWWQGTSMRGCMDGLPAIRYELPEEVADNRERFVDFLIDEGYVVAGTDQERPSREGHFPAGDDQGA